MAIGPLQVIVIGFEGNQFTGEILPELQAVREKGIIRLLDLIFVAKDEMGNVEAIEVSDITGDEALRLGAVLGGLLGAEISEGEGANGKARLRSLKAVGEAGVALSSEEIQETANLIPDNSSALIALIEHTWAVNLQQAVSNSGGVVLGQGLLDPADLERVNPTLAAALKGEEGREDSGRQTRRGEGQVGS